MDNRNDERNELIKKIEKYIEENFSLYSGNKVHKWMSVGIGTDTETNMPCIYYYISSKPSKNRYEIPESVEIDGYNIKIFIKYNMSQPKAS